MTPKERAAMQQGLEALEELFHSNSTNIAVEKYDMAHTALREALAEPVKQSISEEAFNWIDANAPMFVREALAEQAEQGHFADTGNMVFSKPSVFDGVCCGCSRKSADGWALYCVECWEKSNGDLFANGGKMIAEQAEQEPVAWANPHDLDRLAIDMKVRACGCPLYTVALYKHPVRTKDLTAEEIDECWNCSVPVRRWRVFARAVIEKFKEKNK